MTLLDAITDGDAEAGQSFKQTDLSQEQIKVANDVDLRLLSELFTDIRHQETVALTALFAIATFCMAVIATIQVPNLTQYDTVLSRVYAIEMAIQGKLTLAVFTASVILLSIGVLTEKRSRCASSNIEFCLERIASRSSLPIAAISRPASVGGSDQRLISYIATFSGLVFVGSILAAVSLLQAAKLILNN